MNIIFKDDTLFVEMEENVSSLKIRNMKKRVFSILNQYEIENVIISGANMFDLNRDAFSGFIHEYHDKFHGNLTIKEK